MSDNIAGPSRARSDDTYNSRLETAPRVVDVTLVPDAMGARRRGADSRSGAGIPPQLVHFGEPPTHSAPKVGMRSAKPLNL